MKIVIAPLKEATARQIGAKPASVGRRRIRNANGGRSSELVVDFASDTIDRDLTYVFGRNIARARQENKRLLGSADGVRSKG